MRKFIFRSAHRRNSSGLWSSRFSSMRKSSQQVVRAVKFDPDRFLPLHRIAPASRTSGVQFSKSRDREKPRKTPDHMSVQGSFAPILACPDMAAYEYSRGHDSVCGVKRPDQTEVGVGLPFLANRRANRSGFGYLPHPARPMAYRRHPEPAICHAGSGPRQRPDFHARTWP